MLTQSPVARRIALREKYTEEASFQLVRGTATFEVRYTPDTVAPTTGVVICPSIMIEMLTNYRREVLLARALASRGMAVQRFHYRGTGHSDGEEAQLTTETMVEDALEAATRLSANAGVKQLAFVGVRWGTVVATRAALQHLGSPLVLWEPMVTGEQYFAELIRARLVYEMKDARSAGQADSWKAELARNGRVEILGHPLYRSFLESGRPVRLSTMLAGRTSPTLVIQFGRKATWAAGSQPFQDQASQASIEMRFVREVPSWLFPEDVPSESPAVTMTADWLEDCRSRSAQR